MRRQAKGFTVERVKRRRSEPAATSSLGLLTTSESPAPTRGLRGEATSATGLVQAASQSFFRGPVSAEATPPAEAKPSSVRILPDLTANERQQANGGEEEPMARERRPRRLTKERKAPETRKARRRAAKSAPKSDRPEPAIVAAPTQAVAMPAVAAPAASGPRPKRRVRQERTDQDLSPRQLRRAVVRGKVKPEDEQPFGRRRAARSPRRHWSSLVRAAKRDA